MACDILDIVDVPKCVLQTVLDFAQGAINAPLLPFLNTVKMLLAQPANVSAFGSLWAVVIYILSVFYGLFIMGAGFNFIISSYSAEKRYQAKEWLQSTILMILFVQASFLIYGITSQLASALTSGILSMVPSSFFQITLDSANNIGLELMLGLVYFLTLLITIVSFSVNYFLASIGVVFFPFGIFFYFIHPLRDIGKFIMSKLAFILFLPFFASIILLGVSSLLNTSGFSEFKVVFMIGAFTTVNVLMVVLGILAIFRSVMGVMRSDAARALLFIKGHFLAGASAEKVQEPLEANREYWGKFRKDKRESWKR